VEITRMPFDFSQELTVVEHLKGGCTMVRDEEFRLAPVCSDLVLQNRTQQSGNRGGKAWTRPQQHRRASNPT
jgi:hypothetical protein